LVAAGKDGDALAFKAAQQMDDELHKLSPDWSADWLDYKDKVKAAVQPDPSWNRRSHQKPEAYRVLSEIGNPGGLVDF
jgi:hypothetical protein